MGRKGKWLSSVKKAFSPESNKKKSQKAKSKHSADGKPVEPDAPLTVPHPFPSPEEMNITEVENTQISSVDSETVAVATENEAVSKSPVEVVTIPMVNPFEGKSEDDVAAIKIQTAFRGYRARKSVRGMRGLVRLRSLVQGPPVKRQTATALRCMQTLARVQTQIQSRRIRMSEENQALQRQLLQNRAKELATVTVGEEWNDTSQSKEELEANLLNKYEAAMRREKAMAYSFTHQQTWKKLPKPTNLMFMDPNNPQWGWSWLERWTEPRPETTSEKEIEKDEITKAYAHHLLHGDKSSAHKSKATPSSRKLKLTNPEELVSSPKKDDPKSPLSVTSDRTIRRHTIGGSLMKGSGSPRSVPSYMAPTKSAKAKVSPLGLENGTPEKDVLGPTKKRLSFPASPARPRRHSGPPKVDLIPDLDQNVINSVTSEEQV